MKITDLLEKTGEWLKGRGPDSNIVISSRIRLARNLSDVMFPVKMVPQDAVDIISTFREAAFQSAFLREMFLFEIDKISEIERVFLLERHLVSQDFIKEPQGKALFLRRDEVCSIMVNEEDHLRIQVVKSGFDLDNAWELASKIDDEFGRNVEFAYSDELGYLTSCPTNVGTGLRASCMLHLPGLIITKRVGQILQLLAKLSYTARGFLGEGTQAVGNFFQISNQATLGTSEQEIVASMKGIIKQLMSQEIEARGYLMSRHRVLLEDKIWRSAGILKGARLISSAESLTHLSLLRLGLDLGIVDGIGAEELNNLIVNIQPSHLQHKYKKQLEHSDRDMLRAMLLRGCLDQVKV